MATTKGNKIELKTFQSYGKSDIIGFKSVKEGDRTYVNFIWCKVCEKNKDVILKDPTIKGSIKSSARAFIDGTNMVTKHQVCFNLFTIDSKPH